MKKNDARRAFWKALQQNDAKAVATFFKAGVDPDTPWPLGDGSANQSLLTPVFLSAQLGNYETCALLLKHGADPDGGNRWMTPLCEAALHGHAKIVALLKKSGARQTLFTRIALDDLSGVRRALKKKGAETQRDELGNTPLHYAARRLSLGIAALLLKHGADAREANVLGKTALHAACDVRAAVPLRQCRMIKLLLKHGADINAGDARMVTPLHVAVRGRNAAAVGLLLKHGADANALDCGNSSPLRRAVTNTGAGGTAGHQDAALEIARLLINHGADTNAKDKKGRMIAQSATSKAMKMLLAAR